MKYDKEENVFFCTAQERKVLEEALRIIDAIPYTDNNFWEPRLMGVCNYLESLIDSSVYDGRG